MKRQKSKLATTDSEYRRVYLRSSKPHAERLREINFRTLLRELPNGHRYRLAGNGRIIPRVQDDGSTNRTVNRPYNNRASQNQTQDTRADTSFNLHTQQDFPSPVPNSQNSLFQYNGHA